ncbi:MAG: hypothetical protein K2Q09_01195, partial [Phycisphaerales bacterium]|nr:hypothetical protein [Phycisphaerales bacterium]
SAKIFFPNRDTSLRPVYSELAWSFLNQIYNTDRSTALYTAALAESNSFLDLYYHQATLFSSQIRNSEPNWTSSVATAINRLMSRFYPEVECRAMVELACRDPNSTDLRKSTRLDIGMMHSTDRQQSVPLCIEVKMADDSKNELAQNARYCSSLARLGMRAHFLSIVIAFPRPISQATTQQALGITVQLLMPIEDRSNKSQSSSSGSSSSSSSSSSAAAADDDELLFFPMTLYQVSQVQSAEFAQELARLLVSICTISSMGTFEDACQEIINFHEHIQLPSELPSEGEESRPHRIPALGFFEGRVIKVYHPPVDQEARTAYRRPSAYPTLMPGSQVVVDTEAVKVLTYPWIDGEVCPRELVPQHFLMAASELQRLYNEVGLEAHGDVRMANLILSSDKAQWIDFDYSVLQNEARCYPSSWNVKLSDSTRHPDSVADKPILRTHDLYSFSKLLKCYQPNDEEDRANWSTLSNSLSECSEIEAMVTLLTEFCQQHEGMRLTSLISSKKYPGKGTGSPKKRR